MNWRTIHELSQSEVRDEYRGEWDGESEIGDDCIIVQNTYIFRE